MSRVVMTDTVHIDIHFCFIIVNEVMRRRSSSKLRCYALSADYLRGHVLTHALNGIKVNRMPYERSSAINRVNVVRCVLPVI